MAHAQYDAHSSASKTELTFTLQGEDPYSPAIISLWASLMSGDINLLDSEYELIRQTLKRQINQGNSFGDVQMERGKHTKAYRLAMQIRSHDEQPIENKDYDAHKSAKEGETTFTLQSGDPYCADLAELWAALITGNENETDMRFQQITKTFMQVTRAGNEFGRRQMKKGKVIMAYSLVKDMTKAQNSSIS